MREIEFRTWDKHLKMMDLNIHKLDTLSEYIARENHIVMQYTGLKDKNGVKIFEGDIATIDSVSSMNMKFIVDYNYCSFGMFWTVDNNTRRFFNNNSVSRVEVIGNIYENKELLETKWQVKYYGGCQIIMML